MSELRLPKFDVQGLAGSPYAMHPLVSAVIVVATLVAGFIVVAVKTEVRDVVTVQGWLETGDPLVIRAPSAGIIDSIFVESGDTVEAAQALLIVRSMTGELELEGLRFDLRDIELQIEQMSRNLTTDRHLLGYQVERATAAAAVTRADVLTAMLSFRIGENVDSVIQHHRFGTSVILDRVVGSAVVAQAEVNSARMRLEALDAINVDIARLEVIRDRTRHAIAGRLVEDSARTITATGPGIVLDGSLSDLLGQAVSAGTPLLTLAALTGPIATARLNESDLTRVAAGDSVTIQIPALPPNAKAARGIVEYLAPSASNSSDGLSPGGFRMQASVDPSTVDYRLGGYSGYSAEITIVGRPSSTYEALARRLLSVLP